MRPEHWLYTIPLRLRSLFRRAQADQQLDDELRDHLERKTEEYVAKGMSPQEARRRVRLDFGGIEQTKEKCRDARRVNWIQDFVQDLHFSLRVLRKSPGFTIVAVLTLALGIGANTAIFSVLDSVLLRELPVPNPQELSVLTDPDSHGSTFGGQGGERSQLAYSEFQYLRDHNDVFSHIFAADSQINDVNVSIGTASAAAQAHTELVRAHLVSGDYFDTLGIKPAAGQLFTTEVDRARGGAPVAVISYAFWKRRFGLDPSALARTIQVRNASFVIIGVNPPGFFGETVGNAPDVWLPVTMADVIYPGRDLLTPSPQGLLNQHLWLQV